MADAELTPVQRFVLVTLMIKASALPNTYFDKVAGISLKRPYRNDLRDRGFITVTEKPLVLELTERGWAAAIGELGAAAPARAGSAGGALYVALQFLRELLDHLKVAPAELFTLRLAGRDLAAESTALSSTEESIRKAYGEVGRPGDYVRLAEVRSALRAEVDAALVRMNREPDVQIIPNSQQGDLTDEDRAAAVRIGNQDRHLIAITS
ncbi:hypothetical protein ACN28C_13450 [Plantactinospora sp. WMMC1484]|uniref:hypothetical protein n=1 Tax=Plantactinospora sp. WMMC1484 TaxID=3404122 RepID=UPI003BF57C73